MGEGLQTSGAASRLHTRGRLLLADVDHEDRGVPRLSREGGPTILTSTSKAMSPCDGQVLCGRTRCSARVPPSSGDGGQRLDKAAPVEKFLREARSFRSTTRQHRMQMRRSGRHARRRSFGSSRHRESRPIKLRNPWKRRDAEPSARPRSFDVRDGSIARLAWHMTRRCADLASHDGPCHRRMGVTTEESRRRREVSSTPAPTGARKKKYGLRSSIDLYDSRQAMGPARGQRGGGGSSTDSLGGATARSF